MTDRWSVLDAIKKHPNSTVNDLSLLLNTTNKSIEHHVKKLVEAGLIKKYKNPNLPPYTKQYKYVVINIPVNH